MTDDKASGRPVGLDLAIMFRRDLVIEGWNDRAIQAMVRGGTWARVRRGAYVSAAGWKALDRRDRHVVLTRVVLRQARTDLVVSHASALPLLRVPTWGMDLSEVHVTRRDRKAGRREAGVRQHRGKLLEGDTTKLYGLEVSSPTRLALELTTVASSEASLVAINHLLHVGATTMPQLRARYELDMECWPSTLRTGLVLRRAISECESVAESRFWHLCCVHHLAPVPQFPIVDHDGKEVFRVDFAWPEFGVFIEIDGKVKYTDPFKPGESAADVLFREKRREDQIRELTGWLCVRVSWADLAEPERLLARIRAAFVRARRLSGVS